MLMSRFAALIALSGVTVGLSAHPGHETETGLAAGLLHPVLGIDHLLAMVTVGLLGARLGGRWRWVLPLTFVAAMGLGGTALAQITATPWEWAVAASVIVLGLLVAAAKAPYVALGLCAIAGAIHGHAHFSEGAGAGYVSGMLIGTALLHAAGLGIGLVLLHRQNALRWSGAAMGAAGVILTTLALT